MTLHVRIAQPTDVPALNAMIERSARALSVGFYTPREIDAVVRHVFGVDTRLIEDQSYFMVFDDDQLAGCGGWSRRRALYGGDQRRVGSVDWLDPAVDAARIRAFFVAPEFARRGVGRRLLAECIRAATDAGFGSLELMATLPGVPFYSALGFAAVRDVVDDLPDGTPVRFVQMQRAAVAGEG
jgi:GNAT superfamily N-acetyltransferase